MSKSPAFQIYPGDLLSSPRVAVMTTEEFGAYMKLIFYSWLDADCTIPDDDNQLAAMTGLGEGWLKGASRVVRACFEPHPRLVGRLVNLRLVEERVKQLEWSAKSAAGGRKSAQVRRAKALELLKGGSTTLEPPLPNGSNQTPTKGQHSSLQSSVSEEREVSGNEDFSANAEVHSGKKASAKTDAAAVRDPLSGEGNKVGRWLAKLCHGAVTPESRARFTKEQVLAIKAEAKRVNETCDVDRLPEWKEWFDKSWLGKQFAKEGGYPKLSYVRENWSKAFPDVDPDEPAEEESPVEGTLA
jgi:uncharacterized protein YdaU (DUF1376 family)